MIDLSLACNPYIATIWPVCIASISLIENFFTIFKSNDSEASPTSMKLVNGISIPEGPKNVVTRGPTLLI